VLTFNSQGMHTRATLLRLISFFSYGQTRWTALTVSGIIVVVLLCRLNDSP